MAGVGRKSDFGKSEYDTDMDVENRLDTTDPLVDETIPFEDRVKSLTDRGMRREQAIEWINHALQDARDREYRKRDILVEQSKFRKELGELKNCTPVDESCLLPGPEGEEHKAPDVRRRQGPLPEKR
jgi:hypothetical protein